MKNLENPRISNNGTATWDCVYFGHYPQSSDGNGGFKPERIKWRVLSVNGDEALLLADKNLDIKPYNQTYESTTWENCTLRSWLNGEFLETAFTPEEQEAILGKTTKNEDTPEYGTSGGSDTHDKAFLLSLEEATNPAYGFPETYGFPIDTHGSMALVALNTAYAASKSDVEREGQNTDWWLRSTGHQSNDAAIVELSGLAFHYGFRNHTDHGVRPAIWLDLTANHWDYAETTTKEIGGGYKQ